MSLPHDPHITLEMVVTGPSVEMSNALAHAVKTGHATTVADLLKILDLTPESPVLFDNYVYDVGPGSVRITFNAALRKDF